MKTHSPTLSSLRQGFTLIELLVVIVIIAILASLAVPVTNIVMARANALRTKSTMKDIQVAIGHYRTEYNRFPIDASQAGGDADLEPFLTDGNEQQLINTLMANVQTGDAGTNLNPRQIKFLDLPFAKNNLFGIIDPSGGSSPGTPVQLVDVWGMPYVVAIDTNYDNRLENPDKQSNDSIISSKAPDFLSSSSAIYSYGPDKQQFTKDDITSWR